MSDSLDLDEDTWILDLISLQDAASPKKARKPLLPSDDEIAIPAVFLTQGAKNSRLLRQSEEIFRQIDEEDVRVKQQLEQLETLRRNIVAELNDNGSGYTYTLRADAEVVNTYVQMHMSGDPRAVSQRHFYYFSDTPHIDAIVAPEVEIMLDMVRLLKDPLQVTRYLASHGCTMTDFVLGALAKVESPETLRLVDNIVALGVDSAKPSSLDPSLADLLAKVGAVETPDRLPLKYVQYRNGDQDLLVLRLAIIFRLSTAHIDTQALLLLAVRQFALCCSDYILCKRAKATLQQQFVEPVFLALLRTGLTFFSADELADEIHQVFQLKTHLYGDSAPQPQKDVELHFNLLNSLSSIFHGEHEHGAFSLRLAMLFLLDKQCSGSVADLRDVIVDIGKTKPDNDAGLCKNFYRAHLAASCLVHNLYSQEEKNDYFSLYLDVLACKDNLQQTVGELLYAKADVHSKGPLASMVTDTYHVLDHLATVLDKNIILMRRDIFYENSPLL